MDNDHQANLESMQEQKRIVKLAKKATKYLEEKSKSDSDNPIWQKLIDTCRNIETVKYLASGNNSDVFVIGNGFVLKRNETTNYDIPQSEFVLQPHLQCNIEGQEIEIYDRMIPPLRTEYQIARVPLRCALERDGLSISDYNGGAMMINPKTGLMQIVDNQHLDYLCKDKEQARQIYDMDPMTTDEYKIEAMMEKLYFPEAIKRTKEMAIESQNELSI